MNVVRSTDVKMDVARNMTRTIDLDIDIGADAVDYKYVLLHFFPHVPPFTHPFQCYCQPRVSIRNRDRNAQVGRTRQRDCGRAGLSQETGREIRQHEPYVSPSFSCTFHCSCVLLAQSRRTSACKTLPGSRSSPSWVWVYGRFSIFVPSLNASTSLTEQCYISYHGLRLSYIWAWTVLISS